MKMPRSDKLSEAIAEAKRFITKAEAAKASCRMISNNLDPKFDYEDWDRAPMASALRSSMDLSKALSSLRRRELP